MKKHYVKVRKLFDVPDGVVHEVKKQSAKKTEANSITSYSKYSSNADRLVSTADGKELAHGTE